MKKQTITYLFRSALLIGLILFVSRVMPAPGERQINKKLSAASVPHPAGLNVPDSGSVGWGHGPNYPGGMIQDQTVAGGSCCVTQDQPNSTGHLYTFAGVTTGGAFTANSYKFDGTTWTSIAPYPGGPTDYPAAVAEESLGKIYIMNGVTDGPVFQTTVYRYDPGSDSYTSLAPNTVAVMACSVVSGGNGKLYKMGGIDASNVSRNELEIYDIVANTWLLGAPMPVGKAFMSAWHQGNFIYAAGGTTAGSGTATAFKYDIAANTWSSIASLPATRWGAASSFYIDSVLLAGGYVGGDVDTDISTSVISYDAGADAWISICGAMPDERARMNGAVLGGSFYVIGGRSMASGNDGTDTVQVGTAGSSCPPYATTTMTGVAITPGTDLVPGSQGDDVVAPITLPFDVTLFGTNYPAGTVIQGGSNGSLQFTGTSTSFGVACPLPDAAFMTAILPYQDDLHTGNAGEGIFTTVTGTAPNRTFWIEWRTHYFGHAGTANFEICLREGNPCFDVIYGSTSDSGSGEESGVQSPPRSTTFSCLAGTLVPGLKVTYCPNTCIVPVPTSAVSRKVHGGAGTFDVNLPLVPLHDPGIGIEDRQQGVATALPYWLNVTVVGDGTGRSFDSTTSGANAVGMPPGNNQNAFFNSNFFGANFTSTANQGQPYDFSMGLKNGSTLLWYNGDFNGINGLANENNTSLGSGQFASVYDDFLVTGGGFDVTSVFSDNLLNTTVTGASWEIRSGISEGNGGTLVASGSTMTPIVTPTGRVGFGFTEYQVEVPISPALHLPFLAGGGFSHQIVVTFPTTVTVATASVSAGIGSVDSFTGNGTNTITINLSGITNAQRLQVTLGNVCDGTNQGDVLIPMGVLYADSGGNGTVNASDISQIKARGGQVVGAGNFRSDINANGTINAGDIAIAKQRGGTGLPAQ